MFARTLRVCIVLAPAARFPVSGFGSASCCLFVVLRSAACTLRRSIQRTNPSPIHHSICFSRCTAWRAGPNNSDEHRSVGGSVGRCVGGAPHTAMFDDEARELSHPRVSDAPPAVRPSVRASVHSSHSRHSVSQSVCLGHGIYNRPYLHRRSRANCHRKPRKCSCR